MGNEWFTAPVVLIISGLNLRVLSILNTFFFLLAKLSMILGAAGCVGAWFEKKALLFIVNRNHLFYLLYLFFFEVYYNNDCHLCGIITWCCICHCF
jgi:hypothetical protein